jgi:hypothetical protein
MLPLKYGYAVLVSVGMILWTVIFILRRDLRKSMIQMGIAYGLLSVVTAYIWWTRDWWHPFTITGTKVGIEDFFTGFGAGPVMMTIYQFFFNKKLVTTIPKTVASLAPRVGFSACVLAAIHILIYGFHLTSFWAFSVSVSVALVVMFVSRKDLIIPGIISGALTAVFILPLYWATILTTPEWVAKTYNFVHLSGVLFMGIPIEELVFWFLAGAFIGILAAFTWPGKFVKSLKTNTKLARSGNTAHLVEHVRV